jgi:hypothetical protein
VPPIIVLPTATPGALPRMTAFLVAARVEHALGPSAAIQSMTGLDASDLALVDPDAAMLDLSPGYVWYVRVAVAAVGGATDPSARPASGWLVVDDGTGEVIPFRRT